MDVNSVRGTLAEPNVVPFIDVLLVLLIIFLVITPMTPAGLEALVPRPGAETPQPPMHPVVVSVHRDQTVSINREAAEWQVLGVRLKEIFKTRSSRVVFVQGDPEVEFQLVARAIDVAKGAGIDKVGLMTASEEAGP